MSVCELPAKTGPNFGNTARGTYTGYRRHLRAEELPCDDCKAAQQAYRNERYELRKSTENAAAREWAANNPEKIRGYANKYRGLNPEKHRAAVRATYRRYRDAYRSASRQRYRENLEAEAERRRRYRRENPEKVAAATRRHQLNNPEMWREIARRRKARQIKATIVPFTAAQLKARLSVWGNLCWMCGADADTVDHVKPLAKGGLHALANLRPACRSCNSQKKDRWPL